MRGRQHGPKAGEGKGRRQVVVAARLDALDALDVLDVLGVLDVLSVHHRVERTSRVVLVQQVGLVVQACGHREGSRVVAVAALVLVLVQFLRRLKLFTGGREGEAYARSEARGVKHEERSDELDYE